MLPTNVGEWKKLLADLPNSMPFELDVNSYGAVDDVKLEVESRQIGWDGTKCKPIKADMLVLSMSVDG